MKAGKTRYIGGSSMFAWQFCQGAAARGSSRLDAVCFHAEPLQFAVPRGRARDDGVVPGGMNRGHPAKTAACGRLTRPVEQKESTNRGGKDDFGKKLYGATEESDKLVVDRVNELAKKRGIPQAQIALAWVLQKPYITSPIVGATKMQHLDDAVAAPAVKLSTEEIASLEEPNAPHECGSSLKMKILKTINCFAGRDAGRRCPPVFRVLVRLCQWQRA